MPTIDYDELIVCTEANHNKFWRGQVVGNLAYITFGRIGAVKPTRQMKDFPSSSRAAQFVRDTAQSKRRSKGYRSVTGPSMSDYPDCRPVLPRDTTPTAGSTPQSAPAPAPAMAVAERGLDLE